MQGPIVHAHVMDSAGPCGFIPAESILWICSPAAEDKNGAHGENRALIYL